ncbi:olfactomedin-4-like [Bufo bufo]|uniref:olfactomedin-4-like n=1 Tax=Bufo bufo TaxID=8384 RepID=UPI001ABDD759|nr:olfactomedin-4-like [Bufo bufo]
MLLLLILAVCVLHSHAASLLVNTTGAMDELGVCYCSVALPDNTFPADRLEILEISNKDLGISVQQEITKVKSYQATLTEHLVKLKNLTRRVEVIEMGGVAYTELDFELLRLEIREMESLVIKLRESMDGSNVLVETLYTEVHNISIMLNQLESYDKNNVLAVRREIASLRKRLEDCEKNQNNEVPPQINYGSCSHGGIVNISKPFVVQLNWLGFNYKFGGWGKDSYANGNQDVHWVTPLQIDGRMMNIIRYYPTYDNLLLYKGATEKVLTKNLAHNRYDYSSCGQGGGIIMFNNSLYYNCYNSRDICKCNADTNAVERKTLTDATFNNRFSYASSAWQDIDLASDENGPWVIYSTEQNAGNIVIGKLNPATLVVEKTWITSQYKPGATNAFIVCGVLYATRTLSTRKEEIFYMYDTNTSQEGQISIILDKMMENVQSLSYNPNDHKLYMYNDGYLVTYKMAFKSLPKPV